MHYQQITTDAICQQKNHDLKFYFDIEKECIDLLAKEQLLEWAISPEFGFRETGDDTGDPFSDGVWSDDGGFMLHDGTLIDEAGICHRIGESFPVTQLIAGWIKVTPEEVAERLLKKFAGDGIPGALDILRDHRSGREEWEQLGKPVPGERGLVFNSVMGYGIDENLEPGSPAWIEADLRNAQIADEDMDVVRKHHERLKRDLATEELQGVGMNVTHAESGPKLPTISGGVPMPESWQFRPSDLSNTEIFAALARGRVLYIPELKTWHYWSGKRWQADPQRIQVEKIVVETIQSIYALSADAASESERKLYAAWALKSEDESKRRAIVSGAERHSDLVKSLSEFDTDPYILNCQNGVIDLRTGRFHGHESDDYLIKMIPVNYDRKAECPLWLDTVSKIFNNDAPLMEYFQRIAGYTLTGSTKEQALFFAYGRGRNGKSTVLETLFHIMGDYSRRIETNSLMAKTARAAGSASEDIAKLNGIRMILSSEVEDGHRINESLIKDLTGTDTVTARHLYSRSFDFQVIGKIFMFGNYRPRVKGQDEGIRRRVKMIPFSHTFTSPDKDMPEKLKSELPGILNWMIEGCIKWRSAGLMEPEAVTVETKKYFLDNNDLQLYFNDNFEICEGSAILFSDFYEGFMEYTGKGKVSKIKFSQMMSDILDLHVEPGAGNRKYVQGIRRIIQEYDEIPFME